MLFVLEVVHFGVSIPDVLGPRVIRWPGPGARHKICKHPVPVPTIAQAHFLHFLLYLRVSDHQQRLLLIILTPKQTLPLIMS